MPKYDWIGARKLYDAGFNDVEIALKLRIKSRKHVAMWRLRNKLAANVEMRPQGSLAPKIRDALANGRSTKSIARELGCLPEYVRAVRRRMRPGLAAKEDAITQARHNELIGLSDT